MKKGFNLHDGVFRQCLSHVETARDFLTIHLPPELLRICDLTSLKLENASFIEEDCRPYYADILYSLKTSDGHDSYVYALIEHQSSPDKQMTFRLMRYAIAAMQRHLDAGHKTLPLVIPLLFYSGEVSPYPYAMRWLDGFADPPLAQKLYTAPFALVDITVIDDDEIMQHRRMALLELLQKHIRCRDLADYLEQMVRVLEAGYNDAQEVQALIHYMVYAGESVDPAGLLKKLGYRISKHKGKLMTIAETLRQEGRQEGEKKGRIEGGRETSLKIARSMLARGMAIDEVMDLTGLGEEDLRQIAH